MARLTQQVFHGSEMTRPSHLVAVVPDGDRSTIRFDQVGGIVVWIGNFVLKIPPAFSFPCTPAMHLHRSTWPEVEAYLKTSTGIIFPIGSTEQHGPTGLIGTDAICAEAIAQGVGDQTGALVGPTINVGMALHHTAFPGSISLRPTTIIALIQDYVKPLARYGFTRFFFVNGHGGNIATLKAAFAETYNMLADLQISQAEQVRCRVANWFMARSVMGLARELYGNQEGSHATPSEVALTQYVYPEAIKSAPLNPQIAPAGYPIYSAADFRRHYPDGRMGSNPDLATPEHGQRFYETAVKELSQDYQAFLQSA